MIGLSHYLIVSVMMFFIGVAGLMKRKNLIMIFFSSEILLNSANVALVAISSYYGSMDGQIFALFVIAVAACEVAVGLGLLLAWYKKMGTIDLNSLTKVGYKND